MRRVEDLEKEVLANRVYIRDLLGRIETLKLQNAHLLGEVRSKNEQIAYLRGCIDEAKKERLP